MKKINFNNLQAPALSSSTLTTLQKNIEEAINGVSSTVKILENTENGAIITIPKNYIVGSNTLEVYLNGIKLIKAADMDTEGHYYETGENGTISNQIKLTSDWNLETGDILECSVKGEYSNDTE